MKISNLKIVHFCNPAIRNAIAIVRHIGSSFGLFAFICSVLLSQNAHAALLYSDAFNYAPAVKLPSPWSGAPASGQPVVAGDLTYSGLADMGTNMVQINGGTGGTTTGARTDFTGGTTTGSVYVQFLLRLTNGTTGIGTSGTGTPVVELHKNGTSGSFLLTVNLLNNSGNIEVGVVKYSSSTAVASTFFTSGTGSSLVADGTTTYLIVAKYQYVGANADTVTVWVNPVNLGGGSEDSGDKVSTGTGTANTANAPGRVYVDIGYYGYFDELRIGTTWADVTPFSCPTAAVSAGPASVTINTGLPANFAITASGSAPTYQWQISTDSGGTWNNVSGGSGATTTSYTTPALTIANSGNQYRCVASVACDSSSVTSSVATATVIDKSIISFRSVQNGNWNDTNTWNQSTDGVTWIPTVLTPDYTCSNITVQAGHTVTVTAPVTVDDLVVQTGGEIDASGGALTINNGTASVDCDVFGTIQVLDVANSVMTNSSAGVMFETNSAFIWNKSSAPIVPTATWADGSTCTVENSTSTGNTQTIGAIGLGQSFYNFTWNFPGITADNSLGGALTTVRENFTVITSTNTSNTFRLNRQNTGDTASTLTVGGNVSITGNLILYGGNGGAASTGTINVGGNFTLNSNATLAVTAGGLAHINFNGASPQAFTNSGAINNGTRSAGFIWNLNNGSTLNLGTTFLLNTNNDCLTNSGTLNCGAYEIIGGGSLIMNSTGTLSGNSTNQIASGLTNITYGGTLNLPNLPTTLANGNGFLLFGSTNYSGSFASIVPSTTPVTGLSWDQSQLIVSGKLYAGSVPANTSATITYSALSGTNLIMSGTGGVATSGYTILTATNLATPLTNWTVWTTGTFDGSGNFNVTNPIDPAAAQSFFNVRQP